MGKPDSRPPSTERGSSGGDRNKGKKRAMGAGTGTSTASSGAGASGASSSPLLLLCVSLQQLQQAVLQQDDRPIARMLRQLKNLRAKVPTKLVALAAENLLWKLAPDVVPSPSNSASLNGTSDTKVPVETTTGSSATANVRGAAQRKSPGGTGESPSISHTGEISRSTGGQGGAGGGAGNVSTHQSQVVRVTLDAETKTFWKSMREHLEGALTAEEQSKKDDERMDVDGEAPVAPDAAMKEKASISSSSSSSSSSSLGGGGSSGVVTATASFPLRAVDFICCSGEVEVFLCLLLLLRLLDSRRYAAAARVGDFLAQHVIYIEERGVCDDPAVVVLPPGGADSHSNSSSSTTTTVSSSSSSAGSHGSDGGGGRRRRARACRDEKEEVMQVEDETRDADKQQEGDEEAETKKKEEKKKQQQQQQQANGVATESSNNNSNDSNSKEKQRPTDSSKDTETRSGGGGGGAAGGGRGGSGGTSSSRTSSSTSSSGCGSSSGGSSGSSMKHGDKSSDNGNAGTGAGPPPGLWLLQQQLQQQQQGMQRRRRRRLLDLLAAKCLFFWYRARELEKSLDQRVRRDLLRAYTVASVQHDRMLQATTLNLLLRDYIEQQQYELAVKLVAKTSFPEHLRSNAQHARYLYYIGSIQAVRLEYSAAFAKLQMALRRAPQQARLAAGFRLAVLKKAIVVELLMGDIPERATFNRKETRAALLPYKHIVLAVRSGDLHAFGEVMQKYEKMFSCDGTLFLIRRLHHNVIRAGLRLISLSYSRIPLADVAEKLGLESAAYAEGIVAKAILDGVIEATIDHEKQCVESKVNPAIYASTEPQKAFNKRIAFCLQLHADAVRAMQYPEAEEARDKKDDDADERRKALREELARVEDEDIGDDEMDLF